ncbi:MAG: twin-arginine translocation signal domain-containing protein [Edaphobacter sp.]
MPKPSRRSFLKTSAALAAGSAVLRSAPAFAAHTTAPTVTTPLTQFDYRDIQLLDGPVLVQFQHNHALFLNLNEDSILKPFRQLTGMPAPGEDLGGWYSPSALFDPPKNMTGYVSGYTFGQWVSGLSRAYAVTGTKPHRRRSTV